MHLKYFLVIFATFYSDPTSKNDPISIYEELWNVFNEQYAGFESRNIDWESFKQPKDSKLIEPLSDSVLFNECCDLLSVLNDAHVSLTAEINGERKVCNAFDFPKSTNIYKRYGDAASFFEVVDKTLGANDFEIPIEVSNKVSYVVNNGVGYIRLNSFMKSWSDFEEAYEACMVNEPKALILDIRLNTGGTDHDLHKIAGKFTNKRILGHYKETRIAGTNDYSKLKTWHLSPTSGTKFLKPVYVLTSDFSVSAADVFAMTMKQLPNVTLIGEPTNGSMSHLQPVKLSNGWNVTISHKRTYSPQMENFEGIGVTPNIHIRNIESDLTTDLVLIKTLEELQSNL